MPRSLLAIVLLCCAGPCAAHPAPFSYFDFDFSATGVHGALIVHDYDAAHELNLSTPDALLDPATALAHRDSLIQILSARLHIAIDDQAVTPKWGAVEVMADRQSLRLPFELGTPRPAKLDIDTVLFPYDAVHQSFINIYEDGQLKHQAILVARDHTLRYYAGTLQGRWAVIETFVRSGIHHILIGPDHILFLMGLLLLGGSLWRLTTIVTAFTIGHSITLSLAALGLVSIPSTLVEPAIALTIVVVGVDNLMVGSRRGSDARDLRPWFAAAFGLIHGFGFAAVLLEFGLPREALGWSLAAFNIGVEIGQLAIVMVVAVLLALLRKFSTAVARRCVQIGSVAVVLAGAYWFVQRVWFTPAA